MVAAIPQTLVDKYGHWTGRIPNDVLAALTVEQLAGRLERAQDRWNAALGPDGDGNVLKATSDAEEILAAPVEGATPKGKPTSALKAAGITGDDMQTHGRWVSRIPDEVLVKMDRPAVLRRAELAAAEYARTGSMGESDRILKAEAHVVPSAPMTDMQAAAYRRGVREDLARQYGRWIGEVPDEVLGKLDAAELVDRCEYAQGLMERGQAYPHPGMIHGFLDKAQQALRALPRAEVEAEAARLDKAAMLTDDRRLAAGYMDQARKLRDDNPAAPAAHRPGWLGKALRGSDSEVLNKAEVLALGSGVESLAAALRAEVQAALDASPRTQALRAKERALERQLGLLKSQIADMQKTESPVLTKVDRSRRP
jgi:hypothetical protein